MAKQQSFEKKLKRKCKVDPNELVGKRFGFLEVVELHHVDKEAYWNCKCDCGKSSIVRRTQLIQGKTKSCGHYKITCNIQDSDTPALKEVMKNYKRDDRGLEFTLNIDEFRTLTSANCHYCNSPPLNIKKRRNPNLKPYIFNGLDRKDNSKGYTLENVVTCCKFCNYAKHTSTYEDFIKWLDRLVEFRVEKNKIV
jgi:hypothetical protein